MHIVDCQISQQIHNSAKISFCLRERSVKVSVYFSMCSEKRIMFAH